MSDTKILAVAGKGGVGKTSIAAVMVRILTEAFPDRKILAIDADPAVGLATALDIEPKMTVDDIRRQVVSAAEKGETGSAVELLGEARYRMMDVLTEKDGFSFMAIGRPESAGCYCKINSYLKEVIGMLAGNFDYVVIDGEAGIEQINRRVMEKVTHLFLVTDASKKGRQVTEAIKTVADNLMMYEKTGIIANRLPETDGRIPADICRLFEEETVPVLSLIPTDQELAGFDIRGDNVFYLPGEDRMLKGVKEALMSIGILQTDEG